MTKKNIQLKLDFNQVKNSLPPQKITPIKVLKLNDRSEIYKKILKRANQ